jgi:hypothetical protein
MHGILSWYAAPFRFFDTYAPRLSAFPLRAALRIEPEAVYLARNNPDYRVDRMIEREVPPGERVFSFEQIGSAWTSREILAGYTGAQNEVLADTLSAGLSLESTPLTAQVLRFESRQLRRLRVVQTGQPDGEMWSVNEVQIFAGGMPLAANRNWRFGANPNPWDLPLAFDNSAVTRWRSWDRATPGMYLEVDFGKPLCVDEVRLVTAPDAVQRQVELRGMDAAGEWRPLSARQSATSVPVGDNPRQASVRALVGQGIRYLLVTPGAFGANDFNENSGRWGIELLGESGGRRLYALKPADARNAELGSAAMPRPAAPPGTYDDPDSRICLQGAWTRDTQFADADRHTLTYTNIPGASASFAFHGDAVTYVQTRASNRGIVEVFVDGRLKGRVDLYSASTRWRNRIRYDCLGDGDHVIQLRVTGEHNARACDSFVDLDTMIVE